MDELERIYSKLDKDGTKTLNSDQIIEGKNYLWIYLKAIIRLHKYI